MLNCIRLYWFTKCQTFTFYYRTLSLKLLYIRLTTLKRQLIFKQCISGTECDGQGTFGILRCIRSPFPGQWQQVNGRKSDIVCVPEAGFVWAPGWLCTTGHGKICILTAVSSYNHIKTCLLLFYFQSLFCYTVVHILLYILIKKMYSLNAL